MVAITWWLGVIEG